jgi:hypothetical protein
MGLEELRRFLQVRELSTVSLAVKRAEARLAQEPGFRRQLEKVFCGSWINILKPDTIGLMAGRDTIGQPRKLKNDALNPNCGGRVVNPCSDSFARRAREPSGSVPVGRVLAVEHVQDTGPGALVSTVPAPSASVRKWRLKFRPQSAFPLCVTP